MPWTPKSLAEVFDHPFDSVIDVRSPSEHAEDHLPGAINLPVLDDAERAEVGTLYKQVSPFRARKIGAAMVFRNAADHIDRHLSDRDGAWQPLVYCWRGGQRSGALAWMLREIGWRTETVAGGYKTFRRLVVDALYERPLPYRLVQLGGYTGTAKTELLPRLAARGVQVLDLEGLARHRGSLLGATEHPQPAQKGFDTAIARALHGLDPARPVVVEAESSTIGSVTLPPSVWAAMKAAPWIVVEAPLEARARYLARAYADILEDPERLMHRLHPLRFHRGHAVVDGWGATLREQGRVALCRALATGHYDPAYRTAMRGIAPDVRTTVAMKDLGAAEQERAADSIADWLQANAM